MIVLNTTENECIIKSQLDWPIGHKTKNVSSLNENHLMLELAGQCCYKLVSVEVGVQFQFCDAKLLNFLLKAI